MNKRSRKAARRPAAKAPAPPRPRVSDRIADPFLVPPGDPGPARHDGWNAERKRIFLESLAACGVVEDAARAAGMSKQSAYALRNRAAGRAFHLAWNAALQIARRRLADDLFSRAVQGCVEVIVRDGEVWGERHRYDNRLTMALLTKLEEKSRLGDNENRTTRRVADEFGEFVDIACSGAEGEAADFLAKREAAEPGYEPCKETRLLGRLERYERGGAGIDPAEVKALRRQEEEDEEDDEDEGEGRAQWQPSTSSTSVPQQAGFAPTADGIGNRIRYPDRARWDPGGCDIVHDAPQRRLPRVSGPGGGIA